MLEKNIIGDDICGRLARNVSPTNKNYLPLKDGTFTSPNGLTWEIKGGKIHVTGTVTQAGSAENDFYFVGANGVYADAKFPKAGTYAVKMQSMLEESTFYVVKKGGNIVCQLDEGAAGVVKTFTHSEGDTYRIMIRIRGLNRTYDDVITGSITAYDSINSIACSAGCYADNGVYYSEKYGTKKERLNLLQYAD